MTIKEESQKQFKLFQKKKAEIILQLDFLKNKTDLKSLDARADLKRILNKINKELENKFL